MLRAPSPDTPLVAAWQFDATTADASATSVDVFPANVLISMHFSDKDLLGRNPATLAFWTFDETKQQWVRVPGGTDPMSRTVTVAVNHFSSDAATADNIVDTAPLLDGHNVGLHSGTANLSVPIVVPPGRGGLTPQLTLSYDSGRTDEMRQYTSTAGWAGLGWELSTGSINISGNRAFLNADGFGGEMMPDGSGNNGMPPPNGYAWHLRDEAYVRINTDCGGGMAVWGWFTELCSWQVVTKDGRTYTYGGDALHARYYLETVTTWSGYTYWQRFYYQYDLASITDTLGNRIDFVFTPSTQNVITDQRCDNDHDPTHGKPSGDYPCDYVVSAYPDSVAYNYEGSVAQTVISFATSCDGNPAEGPYGTGPNICMRRDTPRDFNADSWCNAYTAPSVLETRQLDSITVSQGGHRARQYALTHEASDFFRVTHGSPAVPTCSPYVGYVVWDPVLGWGPSATPTSNYRGGTDLLTVLEVRGAAGTSDLVRMTFDYEAANVTYSSPGGSSWNWDYNWKHMTQAHNGLGGDVIFHYNEVTPSGYGWTRETIDSETHQPGFGEEPVVTNYTYANGPAYQNYPDPYRQPYYYSAGETAELRNHFSDGYDLFNGAFRGFGQVTETDGAGTRTVHSYYTTGNYCCGSSYPYPTSPSEWMKEILTGREYRTSIQVPVEGGAPIVWKTVDTTFKSVVILTAHHPHEDSDGQSLINFVSPLQVATTLKDGSQSYTQTGYDGYGNLTQQYDFVGTPTNPTDLSPCTAAPCNLRTTTGWASDTTAWIFRPSYVEQVDPQHGWLVSCARLYYDGRTTQGALGNPTPRGLLTATSTAIWGNAACNSTTAFSGSTNTYFAIDAYGNNVNASVPTTTNPESVSTPPPPPSGATYGWIPSGLAGNSTTYDSLFRTFPLTQANALNPPTTLSYTDPVHGDYVFGRPTQVTPPNGNSRNYRYDTFGRLERYWDSLDSETTPSVIFHYDWGIAGQPNRTIASTLVDVGPARWRHDQSCADGFGRQVETWSHYNDTSHAVVRTDYNAVGQKSVVTNAFDGGTALPATGCDTTLPLVTDHARSDYTYDPIGNVTTTYFLDAGPTPDPLTCTAPGGSPVCRQVIMNGLTTTTIDEKGHRKVQTSDPVNRRATLEEDTGTGPWTSYAVTTYQYDALNRLTGVTDALGNQTDLAYDMAGRKTSMTDADMSGSQHTPWQYTYDAAGRLLTQRDANNVPIDTTLTYDALGRPTSKSYSNGDTPVSWFYDTYPDTNWCTAEPLTAVGLQTQMMDGSGLQRACYDVRGRATKTLRTVDDLPAYEISTEYDRLNQPVQVTYPGMNGYRDVVTYDEASTGNITGLSSDVDGTGSQYLSQTLLSNATPKPWGAPATLPLGNGLTTSYDYDFRQRVTGITTGAVQALTLTHDDASNVNSVTDATTAESAVYAYDDLNRLAAMTIDGVPSASYTYNEIGNLLTKQEGTGDNSNLALCYPASGANSVRPHAVSSVWTVPSGTTPECNVGTQWSAFTYDANGNMLAGGNDPATGQRGGHAFDAENRVSEVIDSPPWSGGLQGFGCVDLNGNGNADATEAQAIQSAYNAGMRIGKPGFDPEMDLNQDGSISVSGDAQREYGWYKSGAPCPKQASRYRYDGNGTLLERSSPGGRVQTATLYPSDQGDYHDWIATPATDPSTAHYKNLSDVPANDSTYIEQSAASTFDTFKVGSFSIPAGATIESVTFNFRWEATGATTGTLVPVYRQDATNALGASRSGTPAQGWIGDKWMLTFNPKTGHYWTVADVNAGLQFGFETGPNAGETPRVAGASVFVIYRAASSESTIYVGGVFEEHRQIGGTIIDGWTEYYNALGRTVAIRKTDWGLPPGALYWPLHDHLGTTIGMTGSAGTLVSSQKYWPYGGTRTTTPPPPAITETDKLYTGQQQEGGDASLGLYNYKARFYSTTLGRFASADTWTGDGLNRYAYVRNNPASANDPTGHGMVGIPGRGCVEDTPGDGSCDPSPAPPPPVADTPIPPAPSATPAPEAAPTPPCPPACAPPAGGSAGGVSSIAGAISDAIQTLAEIAYNLPCGCGVSPKDVKENGEDLYHKIKGGGGGSSGVKPEGWPDPPGFDPKTWTRGKASRPSIKDDHLWDPNGGEWRWHGPDPWHDAGHWDYNPHDVPNSQWQNIPAS